MSRIKTRAILIGSGIGIVALCLCGLDRFLPYGLADMKIFMAYNLMNDVKEWKLLLKPEGYGHTNDFSATYVYRTNIVVDSNAFSSVLRLDCANFRNKGYLLASENQDVLWVGFDGRVEKLETKTNASTHSVQNMSTNN